MPWVVAGGLVGWRTGCANHGGDCCLLGAPRRDAGAISGLGLGLGPAGLGQGLNTNAMFGCGSSEIASEAVSLNGGRLPRWPGLVVVREDGNFGDRDGSDDEWIRNCVACPGRPRQADKIV